MTDISAFPTAHGRVAVYDFHGKTLRTGKDLGVVTRYAANHPVDVVELRELPDGYGMAFHFMSQEWANNGRDTMNARAGKALTYWADWRVALIFLQGRRSWGIERIAVDASLYDMVSQHWAAKRLVAHGTIIHQRRDAR